MAEPVTNPSSFAGHAALDTPDIRDRHQYSITDLSEEFGITPRALRFYEDQGLIAPVRRGTARIYMKRDRARLAWILRAKRVGFSLSEIREMIDLYDLGDGRMRQRGVTLNRCRERVALLQRQQVDIAGQVEELNRFIAAIEQLPHTEG